MLEIPGDRCPDTTSIEKMLISSAPALNETKRRIIEMFPNSGLFALYGSTEAGPVTMLRPDVRDVVVTGVTDPKWSERVVAAVAPCEGAPLDVKSVIRLDARAIWHARMPSRPARSGSVWRRRARLIWLWMQSWTVWATMQAIGTKRGLMDGAQNIGNALHWMPVCFDRFCS